MRVDFTSGPARFLAWPEHEQDANSEAPGRPSVYRAPEQFQCSYSTPRAHQFVFCMIYWRTLFGVLPVPGRSLVEVANAILNGERSAAPAGSDVPRWLVRALERGLATDPQARWASLRELLKVIDRGDRWPGWLRRL